MTCSTPPSRHFHSLALALLAVLSGNALAAKAEDASEQVAQKAREELVCKQNVDKFEHAIDFVRETQGSTWTSAFKEKKLPAAVEKDLLKKRRLLRAVQIPQGQKAYLSHSGCSSGRPCP